MEGSIEGEKKSFFVFLFSLLFLKVRDDYVSNRQEVFCKDQLK